MWRATYLCDVEKVLALLRGDLTPPRRDGEGVEAGDASVVWYERDVDDGDAIALQERGFVEVV